MSKNKKKTSDFSFTGHLLDFVIRDGYKIKYLRVTAAEREYWIKLDKQTRKTLDPKIVPGCWLEITGIQKDKKKIGSPKLKAIDVRLAAPSKGETTKVLTVPPSKPKSAKASILVCQKSSCWKRGGKAVCQVLAENLRDRGLENQVMIKTTGCLKQCKKGPNLVMMPDKARYSKIAPQQVPALVAKHFA